MKNLYVFCLFVLSVFTVDAASISHYTINQDNWTKLGRGNVIWTEGSVSVKDCWLKSKETLTGAIEFSFSARAAKNAEQVQIWAGWGMKDRDNRYALGLRGGNNNDLYLTHYETIGKDKMLAWEPLNFKPETDEWYSIRIVSAQGHIRIYLNDEQSPRIVVDDPNPINKGSIYLGGGWIETEYKDVKVRKILPDQLQPFINDSVKICFKCTVTETEFIRQKQRRNYKPLKVRKINGARTVVDLAGDWLFMPEQEIEEGVKVWKTDFSDKSWHVMSVPEFWNPVRNWLHGQDSGLPHRGSGISDNYREKEDARCNGYTFNSRKTQASWYRHWIELPANLKGKRVKLHFDAVSKVADVYVNGAYAGGHVGMFGEFDIDVIDLLKEGKNLIAVNVKVRKFEKVADADKNVTRAVSVDINNDMLNSLPCGMFAGTEGGIWQPVSLIFTDVVYIEDVFAQTNLEGGDFHVTLKNEGNHSASRGIILKIKDKSNGKFLYKSKRPVEIGVDAQSSQTLTVKVEGLSPKYWSPESPNLYSLVVESSEKGRVKDQKEITFGFRTIESKGNKFFLNGTPYWMRGANHPPCGIAANDKPLANRIMKLMHDGNQAVTRSHGSPFTKVWMDAADEQGVGVSYEGSWPWMMIGDIPSKALLDIWKEETISLVKKYRNHPSLLVWTMNNEMYFTMFYHNDPKEVRLKKWKYLSDVIKEVRKLVPGLPISADSGYDRLQEDYEKNLKPQGIDDGDLDDRHVYFNWYNRDFYQIYNGEWDARIYWTPGANPDRPFFAQEVSTGYLNNDEGHFCRKYIYKHYVPHAYVGDWAWEDRDPKYGLRRNAFLTKELAEVIRRTAPETAGILLFSNISWYRDVWNAETVSEWPVAKAVKKAYQPVLVSAELFGRQFWAGTTMKPRIFVVNNDLKGNDLNGLQLEWSVMLNNEILTSGNVEFSKVKHYQSVSQEVKISLPEDLSNNKNSCSLQLRLLNNGQEISKNDYKLLVCKQDWLGDIKKLSGKKIGLFDLTGQTRKVFDLLGIPYFELKDLTQIRTREMDLLVVANADSDEEVPYNWEDIRKMVGNGLNTLLVHPGKHLRWLMFDRVQSVYERKGRIVNMKIPEHGAFNGIDPMELAWWQQDEGIRPRACRRSYRFYPKAMKDITPLATYLRPHVYIGKPEKQLPEMSGIPLAEIREKKGRIIASEMELNHALQDPVAAKMLVNLIVDLLR